jgi:hypothetical protein
MYGLFGYDKPKHTNIPDGSSILSSNVILFSISGMEAEVIVG